MLHISSISDSQALLNKLLTRDVDIFLTTFFLFLYSFFPPILCPFEQEEVHLYGEEISVDATEKPEDELEVRGTPLKTHAASCRFLRMLCESSVVRCTLFVVLSMMVNTSLAKCCGILCEDQIFLVGSIHGDSVMFCYAPFELRVLSLHMLKLDTESDAHQLSKFCNGI